MVPPTQSCYRYAEPSGAPGLDREVILMSFRFFLDPVSLFRCDATKIQVFCGNYLVPSSIAEIFSLPVCCGPTHAFRMGFEVDML